MITVACFIAIGRMVKQSSGGIHYKSHGGMRFDCSSKSAPSFVHFPKKIATICVTLVNFHYIGCPSLGVHQSQSLTNRYHFFVYFFLFFLVVYKNGCLYPSAPELFAEQGDEMALLSYFPIISEFEYPCYTWTSELFDRFERNLSKLWHVPRLFIDRFGLQELRWFEFFS